MARHDAGDQPGTLDAFEQALTARELVGKARERQIAHWMIGWALRLLGRFGDALAVQEALRAELDAAGESDPYSRRSWTSCGGCSAPGECQGRPPVAEGVTPGYVRTALRIASRT
ncbi:MAG: hypothetical protein ABI873_19435 [Marmoricola sp.]